MVWLIQQSIFSDTVDLPAVVPGGSSITYTVTAQTSATEQGPLDNVRTVSIPPGVTDDNPGNNTDNDIDDFPLHSKTLTAQLFGITGSLTKVAVGDVLTYRVVLNVPVGSMDNTHLIDTLDRGLAFVDCDVISADPGLETNGSTNFNTVCDRPD